MTPTAKTTATSEEAGPAEETAGKRRKKPKAAAKKKNKKADAASSKGPVSPRAAYRTRMESIGRLLNAAVGKLEESDGEDDAVGRGVYLHIMGQVFEALDGLSQSIPLDDLVKLSKVVAEQRRAELSTRKLEEGIAGSRPGTGKRSGGGARGAPSGGGRGSAQVPEGDDFATRKLPVDFAQIVRQIYGTSLTSDVGDGSADRAGGAEESKVSSEAGL